MEEINYIKTRLIRPECKYDVPQKDSEELWMIIFFNNIDLEDKIQKYNDNQR